MIHKLHIVRVERRAIEIVFDKMYNPRSFYTRRLLLRSDSKNLSRREKYFLITDRIFLSRKFGNLIYVTRKVNASYRNLQCKKSTQDRERSAKRRKSALPIQCPDRKKRVALQFIIKVDRYLHNARNRLRPKIQRDIRENGISPITTGRMKKELEPSDRKIRISRRLSSVL